jgi:hypothetical protein
MAKHGIESGEIIAINVETFGRPHLEQRAGAGNPGRCAV